MIYGDFAKVYDSLMYDFDYDRVYTQIMKLIDINKVNGKKILELACGTGSLAEKFDNNYNIDALDISEEMLTIAQSKLMDKRNIHFFKSDMREFNMGKKYNICISICDSLNYILEEKEIQEIFNNVYNHLSDNGLFIFDMNTEFKFKSMEKVYVDEVDEVFYIWENYYDEKNKINTYGVNFFIEEDNDMYRRVYEEHNEKAYDEENIIEMLKNAGFSRINVYDDYYIDEIPDDKSYRLVFVAGR